MLVKCNKHHICKKDKYYCFHAQWHKHSIHCKQQCPTIKLMGCNQMNIDCIEHEQIEHEQIEHEQIEHEQEEFITKEDMVIC